MDKRQVNPWSWQDKFGFSQALRIDGTRKPVEGVTEVHLG